MQQMWTRTPYGRTNRGRTSGLTKPAQAQVAADGEQSEGERSRAERGAGASQRTITRRLGRTVGSGRTVGHSGRERNAGAGNGSGCGLCAATRGRLGADTHERLISVATDLRGGHRLIAGLVRRATSTNCRAATHVIRRTVVCGTTRISTGAGRSLALDLDRESIENRACGVEGLHGGPAAGGGLDRAAGARGGVGREREGEVDPPGGRAGGVDSEVEVLGQDLLVPQLTRTRRAPAACSEGLV